MISIIICSVNKTYLENTKRNVGETIGVEYEILATDNTILKQGICKVYNDAAAKARYSYLCFMHEDLVFHNSGWGQLMVDTLQNEEIGMLGFCGGKYYPQVPSGWLDIPYELRRLNLVTTDKGNETVFCLNDSPESHLSTTVTLDGLLLAMRKEVWQEFRFNEDVLRGFHFYDIDLSMRVQNRYKLVIDHRILVEHFASGQYVSQQWVNEALNFYNQRPVKGPVSLTSQFEVAMLEDFAMKRLLERIAAIDDAAWQRRVLLKLFMLFPRLTIKNARFYTGISKKLKSQTR